MMLSASRLLTATFWIALALNSCGSAAAQAPGPVRGLWVWKGPSIVATTGSIEKLRNFCGSEGVNEIYISVSSQGKSLEGDFPKLIDVLHRSGVRVEALLSSEDADEPGSHREKLLDRVRQIVRFNEDHPQRRFDGIHLDIEPQQRPENKGPGNVRFLPGLVEAYRDVRRVAEPAGLTVNADIQNKLLKGDLSQRKLLLASLPRLTLMLYEVSTPKDGESPQQKTEKVKAASQKFIAMAYGDLNGANLATMVIGLRTSDYGQLLSGMLRSVDEANSSNRHYAGWARHAYNDALKAGE
jgi:hypothetical protein